MVTSETQSASQAISRKPTGQANFKLSTLIKGQSLLFGVFKTVPECHSHKAVTPKLLFSCLGPDPVGGRTVMNIGQSSAREMP